MMKKNELIKGFEDYFAGCDWQEQQELMYRLDKTAQIPMFSHDEDLKTYEVFYEQNNTRNIQVQAKDEDEAREKADTILGSKTFEENVNKCQKGTFEHTYIDEVK